MKRKLSILLALFVAACQQDASVDPSGTSSLVARVQLGAGTSAAVYDQAVWVRVHLVAGDFDQTTTKPFGDHSCVFTGVPLDVPFQLSFEGLSKDSGVRLWTGSTSGRTASSSREGVTADVAVFAVRDTTLKSLAVVDGSALQPGFSKEIQVYSATVASGTDSVSILAVPFDGTDTVKCNGGPCSKVALTADLTPVAVRVSNLYGDTLVYRLSVARLAGPLPRDSMLSTLSTSPGSFKESFDSSSMSYTDSVESTVGSVTVNAVPSKPEDVSGITYNGAASNLVPLSATGNTTIVVVVTNKNSHQNLYVITVVKRNAPPMARDTMLTTLSTAPGKFKEPFDSLVTTYTDSVESTVASVVVTATPSRPSDVVSITCRGSASNNVALNAGDTTNIPVEVTNSNGRSRTYNILVVRKTAPPVARDSMLAALSTTPGTLDGAFDSLKTGYTDSVAWNVSSVVVDARASKPADVASIRCNSAASDTVALTPDGNTTIAVAVTNLNGQTRTYTLTVVRKAAPAVARDSLLSALSTSPGRFKETFDSLVPNYTDSVESTVNNVVVNATARVPSDIQSITYNGTTSNSIDLNPSGNTTVSVVVTNRNQHPAAYMITVVRKSAPPVHRDSLLSGLSTAPGAFYPSAFDTSKFSYVDSVDWNVSKVVVTATPRTAGDVSGVTYNGDSSRAIPLNSTASTPISVVVTNTNGKTSTYAIVVVKRAMPDLVPPNIVRDAATRNQVLPRTLETYSVAWTVADQALASVKINDATATKVGDLYGRDVPLSGDSLWIKLVATDSSGNFTRDSIKVYRLSAPAASPDGAELSEQETRNVSLSNPLPQASLEYATTRGTWKSYTGSPIPITQSQIVWIRSTLGAVSVEDSATFLYKPTISVPSGSYSAAQTVGLSAAGNPAIEYSVGGAAGWTSYSGTSLPISNDTKLLARSKLGSRTSSTVVATYAFPPRISPNEATYSDFVNLEFAATGADSIQYSFDPTVVGGWKSGSTFQLDHTAKVYARSWIGGTVSPVSSATYGVSHDTGISSISVVDARNKTILGTVTGTAVMISGVPGLDSLVSFHITPSGALGKSLVGGSSDRTFAITKDTTNLIVTIVSGPVHQDYGVTLIRSPKDTIVDERDGKTYSVARIGSQLWMTQNLNYATDSSFCYQEAAANCNQHGRLYNWTAAMAVDPVYEASLWTGSLPRQGVCPAGWHVPDTTDWRKLMDFAEDNPNRLQDTSLASGTNETGFGAISTGKRTAGGYTNLLSSPAAYYWSATQLDAADAGRLLLSNSTMFWGPDYRTSKANVAFGVRCVRN